MLRAGGVLSRTYRIVVEEAQATVLVRERDDASLLPEVCPDRHINPDGTFCIGLRAGHLVTDSGSAEIWWLKLQVFLTCQETAHETGLWPSFAQLSHGDAAAELQLVAEEEASQLGLLDEYNSAVRFDEGPIAVALRTVDAANKRLRNGRARCVCQHCDKRGRPLLRRECWAKKLKCLPVLEFLRRQAVANFWAWHQSIGTQCCRTMKDCPLQTLKQDSAPLPTAGPCSGRGRCAKVVTSDPAAAGP